MRSHLSLIPTRAQAMLHPQLSHVGVFLASVLESRSVFELLLDTEPQSPAVPCPFPALPPFWNLGLD